MKTSPSLTTRHDPSAKSGRMPRNMTLTIEAPTEDSRGKKVVAGRFNGSWVLTAHDDTWGSLLIGRFARLRDAAATVQAHRWNT